MCRPCCASLQVDVICVSLLLPTLGLLQFDTLVVISPADFTVCSAAAPVRMVNVLFAYIQP